MPIPVVARSERALALRCPADVAFAFVSDIDATARLFPLLEEIGRASAYDEGAAQAWMTRLRPQGPGSFSVQPVYVSRYLVEPAERRLTWAPVPETGNARVSGSCVVEPDGSGCRVQLAVQMETEVPAPAFAAGAVRRAVQLGFDAAVAVHAGRIAAHLDAK